MLTCIWEFLLASYHHLFGEPNLTVHCQTGPESHTEQHFSEPKKLYNTKGYSQDEMQPQQVKNCAIILIFILYSKKSSV